MKKTLIMFLALGFLATLIFKVDFQRSGKKEICAFCDGEVLERQLFYREERVLGILTHKPAVPGHVLIIPARHVERFEDLTGDELKALGEAIKKVDIAVRKTFGNTDYLLLQKNGKRAGQSVPHVHFHYLPASDYLTIKFFLSPWLKPLDSKELADLQDTLSQSCESIKAIELMQ